MTEKLPLTEDLWNKIWKRQQEREAQERKRIRQAVAESDVPLSPEIVQKVIRLPDKHSRAILRGHPGFEFAERRSSYLISLSIMELCSEDLLNSIANFEQKALAENSTLFNNTSVAALEAIERRIQKELFATTNAAASLVDHSRRVQKLVKLPDYNDQLRLCFGADGLHELVICLRILLHHLCIVEAGWNMQNNFSERSKSATFMIQKTILLSAIDQFPDRFSGKKNRSMLDYVKSSEEEIDLKAIFEDYRGRVAQFHGWLRKELASESLVALRDYDNCIQEKKTLAHERGGMYCSLIGYVIGRLPLTPMIIYTST